MQLSVMLYIVLISSIILLTVLMSFVLVYAFFVLRDLHEITSTTKDTAKKLNEFIVKPFLFTKELLHFAKPIIDAVESRLQSRTARKRGSRSSDE